MCAYRKSWTPGVQSFVLRSWHNVLATPSLKLRIALVPKVYSSEDNNLYNRLHQLLTIYLLSQTSCQWLWGFYTTPSLRNKQWSHMQWLKYNLGSCQCLEIRVWYQFWERKSPCWTTCPGILQNKNCTWWQLMSCHNVNSVGLKQFVDTLICQSTEKLSTILATD